LWHFIQKIKCDFNYTVCNRASASGDSGNIYFQSVIEWQTKIYFDGTCSVVRVDTAADNWFVLNVNNRRKLVQHSSLQLWNRVYFSYVLAGIAQSVQRQATSWKAKESGFDFRQGQQIFLFSTASRPVLEPIQPPVNCIGSLFPGGKTAGAWN
jgi:hypothetical protein